MPVANFRCKRVGQFILPALAGVLCSAVALQSVANAQFSFKVPRSPVDIKLPDPPKLRPKPTVPTGPRIDFTPRPPGLPSGAPWQEIRPRTPTTFKSGGKASTGFEKARTSLEGRLPQNGVTVGGGTSTSGDSSDGHTEWGGTQAAAIRRFPPIHPSLGPTYPMRPIYPSRPIYNPLPRRPITEPPTLPFQPSVPKPRISLPW